MLGCELWTENFDSMLALVKEYIIDLWKVRKVKLYGEPCSTQPQSQSLAGDPRDGTVVGGQRRGMFGKFSHSGRVTGKLSTCITDNSCKTGSTYTGHVVNGRIARAASWVLLFWFNPSIHLAWGDVAVDSTQAPTLLKVRLKRSKTDQLNQGVDIFMGKTAGPL